MGKWTYIQTDKIDNKFYLPGSISTNRENNIQTMTRQTNRHIDRQTNS